MPLKAEAIQRIIQAGRRPLVRIIKRHLTNAEALRIERRLIVRNHKRLTNIALGERSEFERAQAQARELMARVKPLCVLFHEPKWEFKRFPGWYDEMVHLADLERLPLEPGGHLRSHPMLQNRFARSLRPQIAALASS